MFASSTDRAVLTQIRPYMGFTRAEDYHQKFRLKRDPLMLKAFRDIFRDEQSLVDSTAAARVNGFLAGYGDPAAFSGEFPRWGLSTEAWSLLRKIAGSRFP